MKQVFNFLWQSIKEYRIYYLIMICAPILGALYKPLVFYAIKMIVDVISNTRDLTFKQLITPLLLYIAADILISVTWRISNVISWKSEPYVQQGILLRALKTILSFNYSFFQNTPSGSLVSKIKGLFDGYNELWAQLWYGVSYWILASITTGISIFLVSDLLGIIIIIWSSLFVIINYFFTKHINRLSQLQNEAKHAVIGQISDCLSNAQSVKLFSTRMYEYNKLRDEISCGFIPKEIRSSKYRLKVDIINDLMGISIIITMLLIMIHLKRLNLVTTGDFVFAFGMVFQLQENLWHLMTELHKLSDRMGDLKSSLSIYSYNNTEYVNYQSNQSGNYGTLSPNPPSITFDNVSFSYNQDKIIFKDLNFIIKPGEHIGIVGFTGAGKTTLINLLLKIFIAQQGRVLINDKDISEIDCDLLRSYIAIIPQDISLFHRTLMENIRYGKLDASDNDVIHASIKAHSDEFISRLPDGYNTLVGERGIKLSGGQRQRIAIARAILKNAPILVLDEATSSLDSITELYIQSSIKELLKGRTVIAIAHRLSTLKNMDRLIVIDKGKIIESGTHDVLLSQPNSLYSRIWQTQYSQGNIQ